MPLIWSYQLPVFVLVMCAYICICMWGVFFFQQELISPSWKLSFGLQSILFTISSSHKLHSPWIPADCFGFSHHTCVGCFFQHMNLKHLQMRHSKLSSTLFHTFFFLFFIGFSKTNYFLQSWIHVVTKHWCEMNNLHCSKVRNTHWQIVSVNKDVISCDIHSVPGQSQTELVCCRCVRSWCKKKDITRAGMCGTP